MTKQRPPKGKISYKTSDGLVLWMDYIRAGEPGVSPTIRTVEPGISIVFVPTSMNADEAFLMHYHGTSIVFSRPGEASRMHNHKLEELAIENPGVDFVVSSIGELAWWQYRAVDPDNGERVTKIVKVAADPKFKNRKQQDEMTRLFRELMAWATEGGLAMVRGTNANPRQEFGKKVVGFDKNLTDRLNAGELIG